MKRILSFVTVFALSLSLYVANAQEKPKSECGDKAKTECSSSKASTSKAKSSCGSHESSTKTMKASNKSGDGCCTGTSKAKMASKHDCGDNCGDDCKMAHRVSKSSSDNKN